jgi:hypothetical protein
MPTLHRSASSFPPQHRSLISNPYDAAQPARGSIGAESTVIAISQTQTVLYRILRSSSYHPFPPDFLSTRSYSWKYKRKPQFCTICLAFKRGCFEVVLDSTQPMMFIPIAQSSAVNASLQPPECLCYSRK